MMYPFMTLNDGTEIVHSDMDNFGNVKVYIETADEKLGFKHASCYLPSYRWENICGYSDEDVQRFEEIIRSTAHLILEFAKNGGFEYASGF
jgi:hypothetical protein